MSNHNQQISLEDIIIHTLLDQGSLQWCGGGGVRIWEMCFTILKTCQFPTTTGLGYYAKPYSQLKKYKLRSL